MWPVWWVATRVGPFLISVTAGRTVTGAAGTAADAADERFWLEFQVTGGAWDRGSLSSSGGVRFEEALPVRPLRFEKGLRNFAGWWYFATSGAHVGFESWLERDHLMLMDFDPAVRAVSSQPFWLHWRDGDGRARRHAPDFFARLADGTAMVVDVHPDERIPARDAQTFALTASACQAAGWEYRRLGDLDPVLAAERLGSFVLWLRHTRRPTRPGRWRRGGGHRSPGRFRGLADQHPAGAVVRGFPVFAVDRGAAPAAVLRQLYGVGGQP